MFISSLLFCSSFVAFLSSGSELHRHPNHLHPGILLKYIQSLSSEISFDCFLSGPLDPWSEENYEALQEKTGDGDGPVGPPVTSLTENHGRIS